MSERDNNLDQALDALRRQNPSDDAMQQAAARVWARMDMAPATATAGPEKLRSCEDFRATFGALTHGTLAESRRLLVEDHLHECPDCRKALEQARGNVRVMPLVRKSKPMNPALRWAVAAAVIVCASATTLALVAPPGGRAIVESVDGGLYLVNTGGTAPIHSATEISEGERVRTGRGARAVLRLHDGSRVEMSERSELAVNRGWFATQVKLEKGNVIVQAAKQGWLRRLRLSTDDALVTVRGTIFAVSSGLKGSRVSVVEGVVQVAANNAQSVITRGEQATSNPALLKTNVADEVAWSRDSARYFAMLGEMKMLARKLDAIPSPGVRYESRLLRYLPANTVFVASLPNFGNTLAAANQILQDRMKESDALREWWQSQGAKSAELEKAVESIRTLSGYIGDEVIVAVAADGKQPLVLTEVKNPALRQFVSNEMAKAGAPAEAQQELDKHLQIAGNIAILSGDPALMDRTRALVAQQAGGGFLETPFAAQVLSAYRNGAGWLFSVDLQQVTRHGAPSGQEAAAAGVSSMRYLVVERKDVGGKTETAAALNFDGNRKGIASWIAAPSKMGALEFVSPDATVAAAISLKSPDAMLSDLLAMGKDAGAGLAEAEQKLGIRFREDIAQSLGGDVAFAVDGAILPTPSWKVILEVNDAARLEQALQRLIDTANQQAQGQVKIELTRNGDMRRVSASGEKGSFQIWYTFSNGYLVIGANEQAVNTALQNRSTGYWLARSPQFQSQLPQDGQANLSAVLYEHVGPAIAPLINGLKSVQGVSDSQRQALDMVAANSEPAMLYVYGEPQRLRIGTTANLLGLAIDSMMLSGSAHGGRTQQLKAHIH